MAALPTSGGVRSLLAKFENTNNNNSNNNNADASPSRGRTSGDSTDNAANRPLSKVRASFVSVERNGQGSPTPGMLRRTESYGTDVDSSQRSATVSPTGQLETASASPFSPSPQKIRTALASFQGDSLGSINNKLASLAVKDNVQSPPITKKAETPQEQLPPTATAEKPSNKSTQSMSAKQPAPKAMKKSSSTMSIARDAPIIKSSTTTAAVKERKPAEPPTRSAATATHPTTQPDKPGHRTTVVRNTASTRSERSKTPSHEATRRPSIQPSPQNKPAPKSPTRPVRLPASLVTPTAASAARTGALARSQSHLNLRSSPKTEPAKSLSRKPSTLRADAARIANTHSIPDRPRSRMSTTSSRAPQEESFLARMMRPTASSANKMHDKVEPRSPPRLAKAAKLTPKKETPAELVAEEKHEKQKRPIKKQQQSVESKAPAPIAVEKKAEQPVAQAPVQDVAKNVEPPVTPITETFKTEPKTSPEKQSDAHITELPEATAAPEALTSESTALEAELKAEQIVEAEPETPAADSSSDSVVTEAKSEEVIKNQVSQADDADHAAEKILASVPESVSEEPENEIKEAAPQADQQPGDKGESAPKFAAEVAVPPAEDAQRLAEESATLGKDEVAAIEPAQSLEKSLDSVPEVPENAPVESPISTVKAEEFQVQASAEDEEEL